MPKTFVQVRPGIKYPIIYRIGNNEVDARSIMASACADGPDPGGGSYFTEFERYDGQVPQPSFPGSSMYRFGPRRPVQRPHQRRAGATDHRVIAMGVNDVEIAEILGSVAPRQLPEP